MEMTLEQIIATMLSFLCGHTREKKCNTNYRQST